MTFLTWEARAAQKSSLGALIGTCPQSESWLHFQRLIQGAPHALPDIRKGDCRFSKLRITNTLSCTYLRRSSRRISYAHPSRTRPCFLSACLPRAIDLDVLPLASKRYTLAVNSSLVLASRPSSHPAGTTALQLMHLALHDVNAFDHGLLQSPHCAL